MSAPNRFGSNKTKALLVALAGPQGGIYVTDTAAHAGSYSQITAVAAAVLAITANNVGGDLSGVVLPAGATFYGDITSFTLASGKVLAY